MYRQEHIGMEPRDIPLNRLYHDLAHLWPVMSPPEEYAEEAAYWRAALREALGAGRHPILELGVGGGHNLSHLTADFQATAVDVSENMLAHSRRLNPGVEHLVGDMRHVRLDRAFAAVLIHDAINHMLSEADLRAAFATAAAHLEPGGVFITSPEFLRETFHGPRAEVCTRTKGGTHLTYIEYTHDPNPADTTLEAVFAHFITEGGRLRVEHDRMITGIFPRSLWLRLMKETGFTPEERVYRLASTGAEYLLLLGRLRGPSR